jgi:LmbE family N-acetylglucosaminyl deacetylase
LSSPIKELLRLGGVSLMRAALTLCSRPYRPAAGGKLIIAPHADDETLGCGGLIASQALAGQPIDIVFLTDSAASHPGHPAVSPAELGRRRHDEAVAATAVLGVRADRLHFLDLPDSALDKLPADRRRDLVARLADFIRTLRPVEVFAPYRDGGSTEHTAAYAATVDALAAAGGGTLLEYPIWAWSYPTRLLPRLGKPKGNFRFALGMLREVKMRALACHRSQTEPLAPWAQPVLPPSLSRACCGPREFFFATAVPELGARAARLSFP